MATTTAVEPALPWGRALNEDLPNVPVGARIEVKWCLTIEEAEPEQDAEAAGEASDVAPQPQAPSAAAEQNDTQMKTDAAAADGTHDVKEHTAAATAQTDTAAPQPEAAAPEEEQNDEAGQDASDPAPNQKILWWGATVTGYTEEDGNKLAVLKYDAKEGFAEETRHVEFVRKGLLADGEDMMKWRLEGEESPESESESEAEAEAEAEEEDAEALARGLVRTVRENGQEVYTGSFAQAYGNCVSSLAQRYEGQLETLTPFQRSVMVNGMRDFFEAVRQKMEDKGPDAVIEEDDIREATREFAAKRRRL